MNLSDLYARVVMMRPDLAVINLHHCKGKTKNYWILFGNWIHDSCAAALILAKWLEGMPEGYVLARLTKGFDVAAISPGGEILWTLRRVEPTHIEALAAYFLESAGKSAEV